MDEEGQEVILRLLKYFSLWKSNFSEVGFSPMISPSEDREISSKLMGLSVWYGFNFAIQAESWLHEGENDVSFPGATLRFGREWKR
jgi:hypothetical protein